MLALRDGPLHPMNQAQAQVRIPSAPATDANALWAHRLSASFGAIADQIAAASKALATVPESPPVDAAASGSGSGSYFSAAADGGRAEAAEAQKQQQLASRLDIIERTQERLGAELQEVQNQLALLRAGGRDSARGEKDRGEVTVVEVQEEGTSEFKSASEIAIEELQKEVEGAIDTIKLECVSRYYSLSFSRVLVADEMRRSMESVRRGCTHACITRRSRRTRCRSRRPSWRMAKRLRTSRTPRASSST